MLMGDEGDTFSCAAVEDVYEDLGSTQCIDFEDRGITTYYQRACECPGYGTSCALCGGGPVLNPDQIFELEDSDDLTCFDLEMFFFYMDYADCSEWEFSFRSFLEDTCGCLN